MPTSSPSGSGVAGRTGTTESEGRCRRKRIQATEPPLELESWLLFVTRRGYFGVAGQRGYDESKLPEWIAAGLG
jgi:hypothetical protein